MQLESMLSHTKVFLLQEILKFDITTNSAVTKNKALEKIIQTFLQEPIKENKNIFSSKINN